MNNMPLVSILIPMKNAMPFLPETIESILAQTYENTEIIIIDDGSTDDSRHAVEGFGDRRIKLLANEGVGWPAGFNTGLGVAIGKYVMKCDADDLYVSDRIEKQVEYLESRPDVGAVSGYMSFIWRDGSPIVSIIPDNNEPHDITGELNVGKIISHHCAMCYRMEIMKKVKGVRPWFKTCSDIDLLIRISEQCRVWYFPHHAYVARLHDQSVTRTNPVSRLEWYESKTVEFAKERKEKGEDSLEMGNPPTPPEFTGKLATRDSRSAALDLLISGTWRDFKRGNRMASIGHSIKAIRYNPVKWRAWRNMGVALIKNITMTGKA